MISNNLINDHDINGLVAGVISSVVFGCFKDVLKDNLTDFFDKELDKRTVCSELAGQLLFTKDVKKGPLQPRLCSGVNIEISNSNFEPRSFQAKMVSCILNKMGSKVLSKGLSKGIEKIFGRIDDQTKNALEEGTEKAASKGLSQLLEKKSNVSMIAEVKCKKGEVPHPEKMLPRIHLWYVVFLEDGYGSFPVSATKSQKNSFTCPNQSLQHNITGNACCECE